LENLALVFLGVMALAALVQGAFLVALGVGGLRLLRRVADLQRGLQAEMLPSFENMNRIAADLTEVSVLTAAQVEKVGDLVAGTVARVEEVRVQVAAAGARPLGSLRDLGAVLKGLRRGLQVYRQLGALGAQRGGATRRYVGDEHLFI
jgi:hypothetical protein